MSIKVVWDTEEHTTFRWIFGTEWNWAEYNAAQTESNELARTLDHPVNVIVDALATKAVPSGMFSSIRRSKVDQPEKMGQIVVVTTNSLVSALAKTLSKINHQFGEKIIVATDLQTARELLERRYIQQA